MKKIVILVLFVFLCSNAYALDYTKRTYRTFRDKEDKRNTLRKEGFVMLESKKGKTKESKLGKGKYNRKSGKGFIKLEKK